MSEDSDINEISRLLSEDVLSRKKGRWNLHPASKQWNDRFHGYFNDPHRWVIDTFCKLYPKNVILGGGAVSNCISGPYHYQNEPLFNGDTKWVVKDLDFFVVAESEEEASLIVMNCIQCLGSKDFRNVVITRSKTCINIFYFPECNEDLHSDAYLMEESFYDPGIVQIQFVMGLYSHRSQVIGLFDLWPCQVMYTHEYGVEMTSMYEHSFFTKEMYLDCTRLSKSILFRLQKYMKRGFLLITPDGKQVERQNIVLLALSIFGEDFMDEHYPLLEGNTNDYDERVSLDVRDSNWHIIYSAIYPFRSLNDQTQLMVDVHKRSLPFDYDKTWEIKVTLSGSNSVPKNFANLKFEDLDALGTRMPDKSAELFSLLISKIPAHIKQRKWEKLRKGILIRNEEVLNNHLKPLGEKGIWKIINPRKEAGGSFNGLPVKASHLWNSEYKLLQAGVGDHEFFLLKCLCKNYGLGRDMLNFMCYKIIEAKAAIECF